MQFSVSSVDRTFIEPGLQTVQRHHGILSARIAVAALCVLTALGALAHITIATGKLTCLALQNPLLRIVWHSTPITSMVEVKNHAAHTVKLLKAAICVIPRALINPDCVVQAYEKLGCAPLNSAHRAFKATLIGGVALTLAGTCALVSLQAIRLVPLGSVGAGLTLLAISAFQLKQTGCFREKVICFLEHAKKHPFRRIVVPTLLTAAIAIPLFISLRFQEKSIEEFFKNPDGNRNMAEDIRDLEELRLLGSINGISITTIEERARPGAWSNSGFLGAEERFVDVLKQDWATVKKLGITHIDLARKLQFIFDKAVDCSPRSNYVNTLQFRDGQLLSACKMRFCGMQSDIFGQSERWDKNSWGTDILLKNLLNGEEMGISEGVIRYIKKYGFYEGGGSSNWYRKDPIRLVSTLTGYSYNSIVEAAGLKTR